MRPARARNTRSPARRAPLRSLPSSRTESTKHKEADERKRDHAWFIAFAPAEDPKIAVSVLVENGGFGATAAAPIARKVLDAYLLGEEAAAPDARKPTPPRPANVTAPAT